MSIEVDEMVKSLIPQIEDQIAKRVMESIGYEVQRKVSEAVHKHVDEVVMPLVKEQLAADSAEHAALMVAATNKVTAALAERIEKIALDKMSNYDGSKLIGELMRNIFGRGY